MEKKKWNFLKYFWKKICKTFYKTLGIMVAMGFVTILLYGVCMIMNHINPSFISCLKEQYILTNEIYQSNTIPTLNKLIAQGRIINASEVYNHMLEYYNTIIMLLVSLLGAFGLLSYVSLNLKVKHDVETCVDNKFENKDFQCRIEKEIEKSARIVAKETANKVINDEEYICKIADINAEKIMQNFITSPDFINIIKEVTQKIKDDEKIQLEPLEGVDNGDEI